MADLEPIAPKAEHWNWARAGAHAAWALALAVSVVAAGRSEWTPLSMSYRSTVMGDARGTVAPQAGAPSAASGSSYVSLDQLKQVSDQIIDLRGAVTRAETSQRQVLDLVQQWVSTQSEQGPRASLGASQQQGPQPALPQQQAAQGAFTNVPLANVGQTPQQAANTFNIRAEIAPKLLEYTLALDGISDFSADADKAKVIRVFFDPRCPYCHQAWMAMKGKMQAHWIPALALGDTVEAQQQVATVLAASNRVKAMDDIVNRRPIELAAPTDKSRQTLQRNLEELAALLSAAQVQGAVPAFIVPRPNGTAVLFMGYTAGQDQQMLAVLEGRA